MKYAINLFPTKKSHAMEHLGYFLAHYFRYALVLTLFVVLVVFFLRVRVDQQLTDEREKLAMKQAIIAATKPLRTDLENTQRKITLIKNVLAKQEVLNAQIDYVTQVIPKKSTIRSVLINEKQVQIEAMTSDYTIIQLFISRLNKDARFTKVQANKVQKEGNQQYSFSITLEGYKTKEDKKAEIQKVN